MRELPTMSTGRTAAASRRRHRALDARWPDRCAERSTARSGCTASSFSPASAKHFVKGVTYGPFAAGHARRAIPRARDGRARFRADARRRHQHRAGLHRAAGLAARSRRGGRARRCWSGCRGRSMSPFSTAPPIKAEIRAAVAAGVRACRRHPAVFAYLVGNEIPPDMIRWHGAEAVRGFLQGSRRAGRARSTRARWSATPIFRRPNI